MLEQYEDMVGGARVKFQDGFMTTGWIVLNEKHRKSFERLLKRVEKDRKIEEVKAMIKKINKAGESTGTEKAVDGYENYAVDKKGNVRNTDTGRLLKQSALHKDNGHVIVTLSKGGKLSSKFVHRLVAKAFIPNPTNSTDVTHINRIRSDNKVENLAWVTPKRTKKPSEGLRQ